MLLELLHEFGYEQLPLHYIPIVLLVVFDFVKRQLNPIDIIIFQFFISLYIFERSAQDEKAICYLNAALFKTWRNSNWINCDAHT